ncbi:hypothetical protein BDA99DRAFT_512688 [Phascolomyces articulosus]|uniref:N-acetyltransferase domain-containing protein n=1 Tax=Phascolomyces articulosus TaxID=60185 RepID=A0AAD5PDE2_9FUNG|nr:hypothetical protein BDA99DRAFT_512688 [Phascolomyces articulosus]
MKFPYNLDNLTWIDPDHSRNKENIYCYCGGAFTEDKPMTHCESCQQLFHAGCIKCLPNPLLFGDNFLTFRCSVCTQDDEEYHRNNMSWVAVVHLVIYNLMVRMDLRDKNKPEDKKGQKYFRWKDDICAFIDEYWDYLVPGKKRSITWNNTIASVLSTHGTVFKSGYEIFHQSAWWSLHEQVPPSKDKPRTTKVKAPGKPSQKRSRSDSDTTASKQASKPKKNKSEHKKEKQSKSSKKERQKEKSPGAQVPSSKEDDDMFNMSSLSELSSDEEIFSDDELPTTVSPKEETKPIRESEQKPLPGSTPKPLQEPVSKPVEKPEIIQKPKSIPKETPKELPAPLPPPMDEPENRTVSESQENVERNVTIATETKVPEDKEKVEESKPKSTPVPKPTRSTVLTQQEEWQLLQKLDNSSKRLPHAAMRYQRKLAVRRLKRNLGLKVFDLDAYVTRQLRSRSELVPMSTQEEATTPPLKTFTTNTTTSTTEKKENEETLSKEFEKITHTPYACSFARRIYGAIRQENAVTRNEPWLSSWNGRKLRPFIRRDFQCRPPMMRILHEIQACAGKPRSKKSPSLSLSEYDYTASIDYVYFQPQHLNQVNAMLRRSFWEGVDVSESLLFPEFSIVALYKQAVIGCAFMTPEAYITYFAVLPGWSSAGIGQFMLYHLFQTAISKDITLHVSANNNAMILYQKFGFKPEEFIVDFYDKYLPSDSVYSKNAFFLRLRR